MTEKFFYLLPKLEPIELLGVCTILKVPIYTEEKEPRDSLDLIKDVMESFKKLNRTQKRNLLKICQKAIKCQ